MDLAVAANIARQSLQNTQTQLALSSRNIAGASDPNASRVYARTTTSPDGGARLLTVDRASDSALFAQKLSASASAAAQSAVLDGLTTLEQTSGDPALDQSPASKIGTLATKIASWADDPSNTALGQDVVSAARDVSTTLNQAARTVQQTRQQADGDIAAAVDRTNKSLARLQKLNAQITTGTRAGRDVSALLDQRDSIISTISQDMGVVVVPGANNDVSLYTDSGATLFQTSARTVAFTPTATYAPGTVGGQVTVDGVAVTGPTATMPLHGGAIAGLVTLRDDIGATYESQLDEMARGLVSALAETDQTGGGPDLAGLLTWGGGPALPAAGTAGVAATLRVNPAVDPAQGGDVDLLRDGGINGASTVSNSTDAASFSGRLRAQGGALGASQSFDAAAQLETDASVSAFASDSVSWLEGKRSTATQASDYASALEKQASDALSNVTGVNMDDEYAAQLELERSFNASSKLLGMINDMFNTLFNALGSA